MTAVVLLNREQRQHAAKRLTLGDVEERDTISVEETAQILGISRGLSYALARRGELPGVLRLGSRLRVSVHALRAELGVL
ncbi:MAG: helix-turn-helix domain-containing protein [Acidimicrobiales bacterium]|jgi:excisionase family DNA binding protein